MGMIREGELEKEGFLMVFLVVLFLLGIDVTCYVYTITQTTKKPKPTLIHRPTKLQRSEGGTT